MSVRPEDILPDDVNTAEMQGLTVRKGTIAAVLANAAILNSTSATAHEKVTAKQTIKELVPAVIALQLHEHVTWKNHEIQKMIDDALTSTK